MTAASRFRHVPLPRRIRDGLKRCYFEIYALGARFGVCILPAHYYVSEPNIVELRRTIELWAHPSTMPGVHIDLDEQVDNLRRVCVPFQREFHGNPHYRRAINERYGSGRSRFFGYIEAQVLHAIIRSFQPSRIIEIGSGVLTYSTYQAMSMNRTQTGIGGRITCIEPNPVQMIMKIASTHEDVELIEQPIQKVPLDYFTQLRANDIVSIDSNHVVKAGSEVNYIVREILPRLPSGVLVHFHDIYFPYDYERNVLETFIHANETALLGAFLTHNSRFKIFFSLSMLHYDRRDAMQAILPEYRPESDWRGMRVGKYDRSKHFPSSLWLRVEG